MHTNLVILQNHVWNLKEKKPICLPVIFSNLEHTSVFNNDFENYMPITNMVGFCISVYVCVCMYVQEIHIHLFMYACGTQRRTRVLLPMQTTHFYFDFYIFIISLR